MRDLQALPCPSGPAVLDVWWQPLAAALDGRGPALLPVPEGPAGDAIRAALRPELPADDEVALVVPTSGSTGAPKGAELPAAALQASARATIERLGGAGRWLLALPVTHIAGLQVLVRSLLAGLEPVCAGPDGFLAAARELGPGRRYTALVPTQLRRLLADPAAARELAAFDAVLLGGAAAPATLLTSAAAAGVRVVTTYGMSETCGGCVYDGWPLDGVHVALDSDGRIRLGGATVFRGYRLRPEETATARVLSAGVPWHITADAGELRGGRLTVLGRLDDVVVTGGEKVAPASVEAALESLPEVAEAAVVGVADDEWGQRVVAAVVAASGATPELAQVRAALAGRLPAAALPRQLLVLDRLPLLPSGKPDRVAIATLA